MGIFYSYSDEKNNLNYLEQKEFKEEIENRKDIFFEESDQEYENLDDDDLFKGIEIEDKKLTLKDYVKLLKEHIKQNKKTQIILGATGITASALIAWSIIKNKK